MTVDGRLGFGKSTLVMEAIHGMDTSTVSDMLPGFRGVAA
jgi:hypothetical protein